MKAILALTVVLLIPSLLSASEVKRYYEQEGIYVAPDQGTSPDGALDNNDSFRGNVRAGSGRITPGETDSHLHRHYRVSPKKEQSYSPLNPFVLRW